MQKMAMIDLQTENLVMVSNSQDNSMLLKDMGRFNGVSNHQSPKSASASGHLVYVRRKSEAELGKNTACSSKNTNTDQENETTDSKYLSRIYCFQPVSVTLPLGDTDVKVAAEGLIYHSSASSHSRDEQNTQQWEERYQQLQLFLSKTDQSEWDTYLQVLRTLSSVDLSRHAVELEKRCIKLSLEEGQELQRVMTLNVFGKSMKTSSTTHQD